MKKHLKITFIIGSLLLSCWACMEVYPISPPKDPPLLAGSATPCEAPPIAENIIGTWRFESTLGSDTVTRGVVTFTSDKRIIDPDSLFQNDLSGHPVLSKTYEPEAPSRSSRYSGKVFEVHSNTKKGGTEILFMIVVSNECNKIHMRLWFSSNDLIGCFLTRQ